MKFEGKLYGRGLVPRPARTDTSFDVLVRCAAGEFDANIVNLSGMGFRLRSPHAFEAGCEISLEVPRLAPVKGVIRWVTGREAGGVFTEAVAL